MKQGLFTIRDKIGEMCAPAFQAHNEGVARRQFQNFMQKVAEHDRDAFELWCLCYWDDEEIVVYGEVKPFAVDVSIPVEGKDE